MASMNIPSGPAAAGVGRLLLLGGAAVVGAINSLFNVEGGHRAIVFNRLTGIKDTVPFLSCAQSAEGGRKKAEVTSSFSKRVSPAGVRGGYPPYDTVVREGHHLRCACASQRHPEHVRLT